MRMIYGLQSIWKLKRSATTFSYRDYLQAGKSVAGIEAVEPAGEIVRRFRGAGEGTSPFTEDQRREILRRSEAHRKEPEDVISAEDSLKRIRRSL
jgi:hypothetical protein